jgi:small GTP-binding protein
MNDYATLRVAIVGHTNTGKTSLLRTLTRDVAFGEISARPGTTRHVEGTSLMVGGAPRVDLYDTPGLEDSATLLALLEENRDRGDGIDRIRAFLDSAAARGELEQEAKVLRQVLDSDVLLYVIDAREPMLGRHRDELTVLGLAARPLIPVLNFTGSAESREVAWREHLARIGLHAVVAFDSVLFDPADERKLYEAVQAMLAPHYDLLQRLIEDREEAWQALRRSAAATVADLLIDAASAARRVHEENAAEMKSEGAWLQARVREREERCIRQLMELFAFRSEDVVTERLAIENGRWQMDLFAPETLRRFGLSVGSGAVKGAAVGLGVDVITGGLSLGMAATLGATIGALWSTVDRFGRRLFDRLRGYVDLRVDDNTLRLLAARELQLIDALLQRGHASLTQVELKGEPARAPWQTAELPAALRRARHHPEWSALTASGARAPETERAATLHALQEELLQRLA